MLTCIPPGFGGNVRWSFESHSNYGMQGEQHENSDQWFF